MKKILLIVAVFVIPFLFSGCSGKQAAMEKITEPDVPQETNNNAEQAREIAKSESVPLPQEEDIVRLFFSLINEKRIPDAVAMMDVSAAPNESAKQSWGVQFNIFSSISVKSIEPSSLGGEPDDQKTYKVVLVTKIKPGSEKAAIPNYDWENGENIRWVSLKKDASGMWKILGIGTGP
jgi:hypothetical protein